MAKLPELLKHSGLDSGVLLAITVIEPPSPEEELGLRRAHTPIKAWKTAMGVKAIVAMGPVLLAVYGILRIGISIGVRRATKNVVAGFLMKAELSEVTLEGKALVAQLADHDYWYNLFGPEFSHKERRKENRTRGIGATLWELVVHEHRNRAHSKAGEIGSVLPARQPIDHPTRKPKPVDFHSRPRADERASLSTDLSNK